MQNNNGDLAEKLNSCGEKLNADILYYAGPIERGADTAFIDQCIKRKRRRPNVLLIMVTGGGSPESAFRMSRCLQHKYEKFSMYVSGVCKSAGTLVALGADELVFSDHGELGPLDVQMAKKDDFWDQESGLTVMTALEHLRETAFQAFQGYFLDIQHRGAGSISMQTAAHIAVELTKGLYGPIFQSIDPLHLGEASRAMEIAFHYGQRLVQRSGNMDVEGLRTLASSYPSHAFVIDRAEAQQLFKKVREPNEIEVEIAELIGNAARFPMQQSDAGNGGRVLQFLNSEYEDAANSNLADPHTGDTTDDVADESAEDGRDPGASETPRAKPKRTRARKEE